MDGTKERKDVLKESCWKVEALCAGWEAWDELFFRLSGQGDGVRWPELSSKGKDLSNPSQLREILDSLVRIGTDLDDLYTYAHLRHDEDVAEKKGKEAYASSLTLLHAFQEESSWIDPALLQLSQEVLDRLLEVEELKEYRIFLRKIIRLKPYTLPAEQEKLLATVGRALQTSQKAFGALNNGDLKFKDCIDEKGNVCSLTHGTYQLYMRSRDRDLRKQAFIHLHEAFLQHENTLCELLQGVVEQHVLYKRVRGYKSCLEASLYPHSIDTKVYTTLIETVRGGLSSLHEYIALRKKMLGYSDLHVYDLSVPMVQEVDITLSYEEAVSAIIESVAPLGEEYQGILRKGLLEEGWVDRYENKRKRSGAYSSGSYRSFPYILMNYHGTLQDVMTLTHEAGHSMHSYYSRKTQSYQDHQYPIFLAEVASTFHEELLFRYFLEKAKSPKEKAYLINQKIDDIRNTFFRQVLFAEFELKLHSLCEAEHPFTPDLLKQEYFNLSQQYFGSEITLDPVLASEWSRIPHFYYNFYVYQYATGISAAHVLAKNLQDQGPKATEKYLHFLKLGASKEPIIALKEAGVDMASAEPAELLLKFFQKQVKDLEKLLNQ